MVAGQEHAQQDGPKNLEKPGLIYRVTHIRTRTREDDLLYTSEMPTAIVIISTNLPVFLFRLKKY